MAEAEETCMYRVRQEIHDRYGQSARVGGQLGPEAPVGHGAGTATVTARLMSCWQHGWHSFSIDDNPESSLCRLTMHERLEYAA